MSPRMATESGKRVKITFTTYPECVQYINDHRGYMTQSEYIHRLVVKDYNKYNPGKKIKLWEPKEAKKK